MAEAVGDDLTVLADSGVRSGVDVIRLLALGAKGVLLGRAYIYALAAAGEAGVAHLLRLFAEDMKVTMTLTGATSPRPSASIASTGWKRSTAQPCGPGILICLTQPGAGPDRVP